MPKNYRSFTGLKEFHYGILDATETGIEGAEAEAIEFLQSITIETEQEIVKAFGDNQIAELAVGTGSTTLSTSFHKMPKEDRIALYGLKTVGTDLVGHSPESSPPYVACAFARTSEDGATEWIGFTKGMFMMPSQEGSTKEETVEFSSDETEGEFMSRETFTTNEDVVYLLAHDEKGSTTNRDALFMEIFGVAHPDASIA